VHNVKNKNGAHKSIKSHQVSGVAQVEQVITRQQIALESCSNPPNMRKIL